RVAGQTEAGGADRADGAAAGELSPTACGEVDSAEGADAHLHRHYDDENHPKSRFTPLTALIPLPRPATALPAAAGNPAELSRNWRRLRQRRPSRGRPGYLHAGNRRPSRHRD